MKVEPGKLQGIHHFRWTSLKTYVPIARDCEGGEAAKASTYRNGRATVNPKFGRLREKALLRC